MNDPSYRMKSLLDQSIGSLVSHTIAEEEGSQEEDSSSSRNEQSGRFDGAAEYVDKGSDVACTACGFESKFVHEGMRPCNRCHAVFYCSDHCKAWDWNSGGHRKVCKQILPGSCHSIDRLSYRGSESGSSLDADSLFDMNSSDTGTIDMTGDVAKKGSASDHSSLPVKKSLSSYLDKPKPQSSALPNPFANREENDPSEGGESGSFGGNEEESLCVSNIDVSVDMPLNSITEESQVSEALIADASWRDREAQLRQPKNTYDQRTLGVQMPQHDSEGDISVEYQNQDLQALQAADDVAYGVEFRKLGHQSTNSLSANCDTTSNDDLRSIFEHEADNSALLELFDSRATGSSGTFDSSEEENLNVPDVATSDVAYNSSSSTNSTASSIASMSNGNSIDEDEDETSHRTLDDTGRTGSDRSLLKQFREVYNRPEHNSAGDSDDFKSASQRSTSSLREFREIYNMSKSDTSDSSSVQSEKEAAPRSFLGSMHLDNPVEESELVPSIISTDQTSAATDTSKALQQARERFSAKKDTLNEALLQYKHRFGESAAVEALDKISRSKEVKNGSEVEYQWERTQTSDDIASSYLTDNSPHTAPSTNCKNEMVPQEGDKIPSTDYESSHYLSYVTSLKKSNNLVSAEAGRTPTNGSVDTTDSIPFTNSEDSHYLSYKRSLNGSNCKTCSSKDRNPKVEASEATKTGESTGDEHSRYSFYKKSLKRSNHMVGRYAENTLQVFGFVSQTTSSSSGNESSQYLAYKKGLKGSNHHIGDPVDHTSSVGNFIAKTNSEGSPHSSERLRKRSNHQVSGGSAEASILGDSSTPVQTPSNDIERLRYSSYKRALQGSNPQLNGLMNQKSIVGDLGGQDKVPSTDGEELRYSSYKRSLRVSGRRACGSVNQNPPVRDLAEQGNGLSTDGNTQHYSSSKRSFDGSSGSDMDENSLVRDSIVQKNMACTRNERNRYLSYKKSLNVSPQLLRETSDTDSTLVEDANMTSANYATYRKMLRPEHQNSATPKGQSRDDAAAIHDATGESGKRKYKEYIDHLKVDGSQSSTSKQTLDVKERPENSSGKYSMYRSLLATTTSSLSADETGQSAQVTGRLDLRNDSHRGKDGVASARHLEKNIDPLLSDKQHTKVDNYQLSKYATYRGALTSSTSNSRVFSQDHQCSKDDAVLMTKEPTTEARGITNNVASYADYRRTLVTSSDILHADKSTDEPPYSYLQYRRSFNSLASVVGSGTERVERNSTSETSPASYYEYRKSLLPSKMSSGEKPSALSWEHHHNLKSNQNAVEADSSCSSSSPVEMMQPMTTEQLIEKDQTVTRSWYRNYRESLEAKDTSQGEKKILAQEMSHNPSMSLSESRTSYDDYRQRLRVRFKSPIMERAEVGSTEITPDDSHNSGLESLEPEPERMPEVVASPTSRSTSSVTSNTDIDNNDATLMPRYLYYKFSLEKAELVLKDKIDESSTESIEQNRLESKDNYHLASNESMDPEFVPNDEVGGADTANTGQFEQIPSAKVDELNIEVVGQKYNAAGDSRSSDAGNSNDSGHGKPLFQPFELSTETKRDMDLLGLSRSVAWHESGNSLFLKLWQQVAHDITRETEERSKVLASRLRIQSSFKLNITFPSPGRPSKAAEHPLVVPRPLVYTSPEADVENQQPDPTTSHHDSSASIDKNCRRREGMWRRFLLLFLRHGIPPLILIIFALGIGLVVARSRREVRSIHTTESPSAAPSAISPSLRLPEAEATLPPAAQAEAYDALYEMVANLSFDGGQALKNPSSPQYMAFDWLLKTPKLFSTYTTERIIQRYALGCFYFSTDGDNWLNRKNWLSYADECLWHSLEMNRSCDNNGFYKSLDMSFNNLGGFLPPELSLLTELETLNLSGYGISSIKGSVPTELGLLTNLSTLNLRNNGFIGRLPTELGQLISLTSMDLGMNAFSLGIPSEFGLLSSLKVLNLEMNILTGEIPWEITTLRKLEKLALGDNRMSGRVQVGGDLSALKFLHIEQNRFTSLLPGIGELSHLQIFTMYETDVTGTFPSEILELVSLKRLILHSNRLFGRLPAFIGNLEGLLDLDLSFNAFSGPIPTHIGKLRNLTRLDLRANFLAGTVPEELGLLTNASIIRIDDNDITGAVSTAVCRSIESLGAEFYSDCGNSEVSCPPESTCCTFCCTDGQGCECRLPDQLNNLCFAH